MRKVARKLRRGDVVMVMRGKSRGHTGKIVSVSESRVIVEGAKMVRRHYRASSSHPESEIVDQESPIHISNVMFCHDGSPTKLGYLFEEGKKMRVSKKSREKV